MPDKALTKSARNAVPIYCVEKDAIDSLDWLSKSDHAWIKEIGFTGKSGELLILPGETGKRKAVLFGLGANDNPLEAGTLASRLPDGNYRFEEHSADPSFVALGWLLGSYRFTRYQGSVKPLAKFQIGKAVDGLAVLRAAEATFLARDLINTPANDLGPEGLEKAIRKLGRQFSAKVSVIKGDQLLKRNFPMIHAVGRASTDAPRLIDLTWGKKGDPKITLVGKGVIFDSGGLNIKPGNSMALMKKDMGGAANTIALAQMIMGAKLPVSLRLLVPAVENAISGNAFRPGDVLPSRKGISVEIGNTDAEGRLILGDALAYGDEEAPEIMLDMATLTGAARVALGPDLPPFYTADDTFADALAAAADEQFDPLWRMPLWKPYRKMLKSKVADINHITSGGFAGSVTAALFLERFVEKAQTWAHFDVYGWCPAAKPWCPVGGEAQGIRAIFDVLSKRYG